MIFIAFCNGYWHVTLYGVVVHTIVCVQCVCVHFLFTGLQCQ